MKRDRRTFLSRVAGVTTLAILGLAIAAAPAHAVEPITRIDLGVGASPRGIAITPDGSTILVTLEDAGEVGVIDTSPVTQSARSSRRA